jgi:hypothetical protein
MLLEQWFMMASNFSLFIPALAFFLYNYFIFGFVSLASAIASNLYHYADLFDELVLVYGVNFVTEPGLFIWDVNPSTKMMFIILDYGFSNIGILIYLIVLIPKVDDSGNGLFSVVGIIVYVFAMLISGSVNFETAYINNIWWLTPILMIYIGLIAFMCIIKYVYIEGKSIKTYYTDRFNITYLILSVMFIVVGCLFWVVVQNYWSSYYFYAHGVWHFSIALGSLFFCLAISKPIKMSF